MIFMLSIEKCRQTEPSLKNLSDDEVTEILENLYEGAQLALEDWLKKKGSKNPQGVLSSIFKGVK
jgi:hypothetical protein